MRVVMLAGNPLTYDGRVLRHASALGQAGHDVVLLGVIGPNDEAAPLPELSTPGGGQVRAYRLDRRRAGLVPRATWLVSAARRHLAGALVQLLGPRALLAELMVAPCAVELAVAAAWFDADVYHANDLDTLVPASWAARLRGRPYIYDAHELYAEESPLLDPAERAARQAVEGKLARGARAVLTVNDLLADELVRRYHIPRPVVVRNVPSIVPLGPLPPPRPQEAPSPSPGPGNLPLVGRNSPLRPHEPNIPAGSAATAESNFTTGDPGLRPDGTLRLLLHGSWVGLEQPGVEAALRAVARLPVVRLTLRGGVRNLAGLQARLAELGIADRVVLQPRLPGADALVRAAISEQHDVGLSVHLPDCLSRRLATSSKVFEYLMAGLAVVAADQEGNRHILDERCAAFFTPGDDADLARVLAELAADRPRLHAAQHAARARAEAEFCWEREQARLLALY